MDKRVDVHAVHALGAVRKGWDKWRGGGANMGSWAHLTVDAVLGDAVLTL